jgi:putative flavoprotein involved in K+ transport
MVRDDVHRFVVDYARSFSAPVREQVSVLSLAEAASGGFILHTSAGEFTADQVIVAVGGYHDPIIPTLAYALPTEIIQIHSSEYTSPDALPEGGVLVVGSGQSGAQIAEDLHLSGREVHLATGSAPRVARFYRGRDCVAWLHDMGVYDVGVDRHVGGLSKRESTNHYVTGRDGGRDIDLRRFAAEGMHLYGRITGGSGAVLDIAPTLGASLNAADAVAQSIKNDIDRYIQRMGIDAPVESPYSAVWTPSVEPVSLDLAAAGIRSIVWSIGYRADFRWVRAGVFDGQGHPTHARGVTSVPGLYFLGLPWLYTWGSGRFAGIARDATYLTERVLERRGATVENALQDAG